MPINLILIKLIYEDTHYYYFIVIKITPDFCHKYRNDMQFPSFWVKIFFFNFLKNVILQFGPFLLSMPHMFRSRDTLLRKGSGPNYSFTIYRNLSVHLRFPYIYDL